MAKPVEPPPADGKKPHLMIIIGVGKPKPGQPVGFRGAKKKQSKPERKEHGEA